MQVLDPEFARFFDVSPRSITDIAVNIPNLVQQKELNDLDDEWREFLQSDEASNYNNFTIPGHWYQFRKIKDALDQLKFGKLSHLMTSLTALPHSNAAVERLFFNVNCAKTSRSNRMTSQSVKCRIQARAGISGWLVCHVESYFGPDLGRC